MKATIVKISAVGSCSAQTENEIGLTFGITDGNKFEVGEAIEVDLPNVVSTKAVVRLRDGKVIKIELREDDLHDLRMPVRHGGSRTPTASRLREHS